MAEATAPGDHTDERPTIRALLVERDALDADAASAHLSTAEDAWIDCVHVPTPSAAMVALRSELFDVVILDVSEDVAEVPVLRESIAAGGHRLAVVGRCTQLTEQVELTALQYGVDECVERGASAARLVACVRRALARHSGARERRFRRSFEDAPAPMWMNRLDGRLIQVNDALCALLGQPREHLLGLEFESLVHPDDREENLHTLELLHSGERTSLTRERRFRHADGHVIWAIVGVTLVRGEDGEPDHVVGQAQDITSRRRYEERLRHMADHDALTGLLNRRGFDRELRRHVSGISRYGARGALLMIDLDNFKYFNDTRGHTAGDNLLATLARGLRTRLRANDVVGRLGGDEFAVLLPEAGREQAEAVATAIVDYVRDAPPGPPAVDEWHRLTTSVGIFLFEGPGSFSKDRAMIAADLAMYEAKGRGRDRFSHYAQRHVDASRSTDDA